MRRQTGLLLLAFCGAGIAPGAAPRAQDAAPPPPLNASKAAPSFHAVGRSIAEITRVWDQPGATIPPAAAGWRTFFDALNGELASYAAAADDKARLASLNRLHQMDLALWGVAWTPIIKVRGALDEWLAPRIRIAWAERRLVDFVEGQKAASPDSAANHQRWVKFVGDDLASALASYEGAKTVQARRAALKRLTGVLAALRSTNRSINWFYSAELQSSVVGLYSLPNLDVSADVYSLAPFLSQNVVTSGPIYRNGYVSQVTAGPKTGFGLIPSDEGIAFYNKQLASTVTPITDFQQQLQQDRKGRKVAKLYQFGATSSDAPELTITAILRPSTGLSLSPASSHAIGAAVGAMPIAGKGLARGVLAILGLNREKLTEKIQQQAYPKIAQGVVDGSNAEAAERVPAAEAEQNAKLRRVLVGNDTLAIQDFRVTGLTLRSRPTNALVGGTIGHARFADALGADMPQPPALAVPESGVSVDVHLGSIMSNVVAGLLAGDQARDVENVMVVTKATDPNAPPKEGVTVGKNVAYPEFLKQIEEARAANNPKVTALRIKKPSVPPEFAADQRGFLVVLVRDFQMEVPAPAGGLLGGNAKVLRFLVPNAEFVLSFSVPAREPGKPLEFDAKVEDLVWGPGSKVQTIGDDENAPTTMGPFQANIALAGFRTKLQQVPIKAPLANVKLQGFDIGQVSPLDPSGWMRVVLTPNGQPIANPGAAQAQAPAPPVPAVAPAAAAPVAPAGAPVAAR